MQSTCTHARVLACMCVLARVHCETAHIAATIRKYRASRLQLLSVSSVLLFIQPGTPPQKMVPPAFMVTLPTSINTVYKFLHRPVQNPVLPMFVLENDIDDINHHGRQDFNPRSCIFGPENTQPSQLMVMEKAPTLRMAVLRKRWRSHGVKRALPW